MALAKTNVNQQCRLTQSEVEKLRKQADKEERTAGSLARICLLNGLAERIGSDPRDESVKQK